MPKRTGLREQVSRVDSECFGQFFDIEQRDVAFAPLDSADVISVKSALESEFFLRPPLFLAQRAHTFSDFCEDSFGGHALHHTYKC